MVALDRMLTIDEVCGMLRLDRQTLYRWRTSEKMLPYYTMGNPKRPIIRYRESDVLGFLGASRKDTK